MRVMLYQNVEAEHPIFSALPGVSQILTSVKDDLRMTDCGSIVGQAVTLIWYPRTVPLRARLFSALAATAGYYGLRRLSAGNGNQMATGHECSDFGVSSRDYTRRLVVQSIVDGVNLF